MEPGEMAAGALGGREEELAAHPGEVAQEPQQHRQGVHLLLPAQGGPTLEEVVRLDGDRGQGRRDADVGAEDHPERILQEPAEDAELPDQRVLPLAIALGDHLRGPQAARGRARLGAALTGGPSAWLGGPPRGGERGLGTQPNSLWTAARPHCAPSGWPRAVRRAGSHSRRVAACRMVAPYGGAARRAAAQVASYCAAAQPRVARHGAAWCIAAKLGGSWRSKVTAARRCVQNHGVAWSLVSCVLRLVLRCLLCRVTHCVVGFEIAGACYLCFVTGVCGCAFCAS